MSSSSSSSSASAPAAAAAPSSSDGSKYDLAASDNPGRQAEGVVLIRSEDMPAGTPIVRGPDFNAPSSSTLDGLLSSYATMGFQATNVSKAIDEINKMLNWRLSDEPVKESEDDESRDPEFRSKQGCSLPCRAQAR
jgi:deoxyhypusine synthase